MILAALFLALAYVFPFLTGQIPKIGNMLCPMHIPVLLCGFLCGPVWGLAVGVTAPLLRALTLGAPLLFPTAVCMACELAAYGAVAGGMYRLFPRRKPYLYVSLLAAMMAGRLVWGAAMCVCTGIGSGGFTLTVFFMSGFVYALPGILVQVVLIPLLVMVWDSPRVVRG